MSGGIEEKQPGSSSLVHDTFSSVAQDTPGPGKRTLTAQLTGEPVQRKAGADAGRDRSFDRYEDRSFNRYVDRSFEPTGGSSSAGSNAAVQRAPAKHTPHAARHEPGPHIASATPGIDKAGFIDNNSGAPLYNRPPEAGGELVRAAPLPPTARVFVSGTYPKLSDWWYVTAYLDQTMVRGYVERVRVAVDLPEPLAELRQLTGGETAEGLAKEKYHEAVRDGHDLRYYENVLLYVNQQHHRKGVIGAYQDPGVAGNGSNNVQLVAGHRIWLVSPEYAKALESIVPSGSLTGGAVAKVKRFMGHLEDILKSVTESVHHVDEVAGEYAQAIRDHMASIIGITAAFITAEAISMFAAATPTGVGQAVAAVIQLALAAFGAAGMVEAGLEAMKHGNQWLTTAWTAHGNPEAIAAASKEFLRMLVAIAMAALAFLGVKGNYRNALKIASNMPTGGLPALATAGSEGIAGTSASTGVAIGPSTGAIGAAGAQMTKHDSEGGGPEPTQAPSVEKPPTRAEAEAEFAAKHAKNIANEAASGTRMAWEKGLELGNERARVQAEGERLYRDAFREEYVKAREAGQNEIDAKDVARRAAQRAAKLHVRAEGVKLAEAQARVDVLKDTNGDGIPDAFKRVDATSIQDFAEFRSGARGALAKQFATELPSKTVEEMETLLQRSGGARHPATPNTFETVVEGKISYAQVSYTFTDGTLVRIKPFGDVRNSADPMFSVELHTRAPTPGSHPQNSVAFKLDQRANPVPKGTDDINNPYTARQQIQHEAYDAEIMRLGHHFAKRGN